MVKLNTMTLMNSGCTGAYAALFADRLGTHPTFGVKLSHYPCPVVFAPLRKALVPEGENLRLTLS